MKIAADALGAVEAHAEEGYPYEICGFLLAKRGSRKVTDIKRATNATTEDPRTRYDISTRELIETDRFLDQKGLDLIGYYHSHPDHPAAASITDQRIAQVGMVYLIISCLEGQARDARAHIVDTLGGTFRDEPIELS